VEGIDEGRLIETADDAAQVETRDTATATLQRAPVHIESRRGERKRKIEARSSFYIFIIS
jgi:hypothetical protein